MSRLACPACQASVDGRFDLPPLLRLPEDDLDFVVEFVRASGSLKQMAKLRGQSYPTIRNRLDEIISRLNDDSAARERSKHEILDAIAKGAISVSEATKKLKEIES